MSLEGDLEHLLSAWPKIARQLRSAPRILLLLDYDGTLTPIVERPELAILSEGTKYLLQTLGRHRRFTVGIVSGRALADLKNMVNINGIIYAGNHGLEIEGPGVAFMNPLAKEIRPILRIIGLLLKRTLQTIRGVLVEDKGLSLSVHYRMADGEKAGEVKSALEQVVGGAQALGKVKVTNGKKVYEIRPAVDWDKGKAIRLLMERYGKGSRESGLVPIYLGDDLTDEDGFEFIEEDCGKGISVFVGEEKEKSAARYFLKSPEEVTRFLDMLLTEARRDFQ